MYAKQEEMEAVEDQGCLASEEYSREVRLQRRSLMKLVYYANQSYWRVKEGLLSALWRR
jgi:hypothetical protein